MPQKGAELRSPWSIKQDVWGPEDIIVVIYTATSFSGRPRQTSCREDRHIIRHARVEPTASFTQAAPSIRAPVSSRTIAMCLTDGHLISRRPSRGLPMTPTHQYLRLEWCRTRWDWTATEWSQVVFNDESRFNLSSDYNRVRVWRPCGEHLNPAFALQRHSWYEGMGCYCLQYTVTSNDPMTAQLCVHCDVPPLGSTSLEVSA
ncbi:transposable element Tcb2 transposase [Trichonephila clavipes]|nr:transposable element Tcb2 transposase [Trichonephila clavipes]